MQVKDSVAIVTGGGSGMGKATAKLLASHHAKVAVLDINKTSAKKTADEINAFSFECDVTDEKSVQEALKQIKNNLGAPSVCINCAGILHARRMINKEGVMPLDEFQRVMQVNLVGSFNVMRLVANEMKNNPPFNNDGERGVIIHTASIAAYEGQIGQLAYSASKGAIVAMTLPAARELASFGIRVMTIAPGLVETPMFDALSDEAKASLAAAVPFPKRLAKPEEFASLVLHIIENNMLNGEVIRLDGAIRLQAK